MLVAVLRVEASAVPAARVALPVELEPREVVSVVLASQAAVPAVLEPRVALPVGPEVVGPVSRVRPVRPALVWRPVRPVPQVRPAPGRGQDSGTA